MSTTSNIASYWQLRKVAKLLYLEAPSPAPQKGAAPRCRFVLVFPIVAALRNAAYVVIFVLVSRPADRTHVPKAVSCSVFTNKPADRALDRT